jgi:hypothetical protein
MFRWKSLLWPLCKEVVSTVKVDVAGRGDSMNILHYVHIKKLTVSCEPAYEIIHGVVCTQSLCHSSVPKTIDNVSLMALAGSVGYERVLDKYSTLEPIMVQEQEYLRNQVDRIASRRLSLLMVEDSVATIAADMLRSADVGVITNVKHKVLERVARASNADVMTSLDAQFLLRRTGYCPKFYQRTYTLLNGSRKNILTFDGCDGSLGVSIILRGSRIRELIAAKRILRCLIPLTYSSKLEIDFINLLSTQKVHRHLTCDVCLFNRCADVVHDESEFYEALRKATLTNSPLIHTGLPFLETDNGRKCDLMNFFKKPLFHFLKEEDFAEYARKEEILQQDLHSLEDSFTNKKSAVDKKVHRIMAEINVTQPLKEMLPSYRARAGLLARRRYDVKREVKTERQRQVTQLCKEAESAKEMHLSGPNRDMLNPYNHQRISFLYCANTRKSSNVRTFCMGPWLLIRQFYSGKDMTLGTFLSK